MAWYFEDIFPMPFLINLLYLSKLIGLTIDATASYPYQGVDLIHWKHFQCLNIKPIYSEPFMHWLMALLYPMSWPGLSRDCSICTSATHPSSNSYSMFFCFYFNQDIKLFPNLCHYIGSLPIFVLALWLGGQSRILFHWLKKWLSPIKAQVWQFCMPRLILQLVPCASLELTKIIIFN